MNPRLLIGLALLGRAVLADESGLAPGTEAEFRDTVQPFLKRHCYECHDADKAKAGLRVDTLSIDFAAGGASEAWIEMMDAINLGEMPPEEETRPDAAEAFEVVKWIAAQLEFAEKAAREAGGRIPMRRLNRDEYANTVRDLLQLDATKLGTIVEDLPGDGKAEGFDRLGAALFFDQTQIERTLAVAGEVAALALVDPEAKPELLTTRFEPELLLQAGGMGTRPASKTTRNRSAPKRHDVRTGQLTHFVENGGVRFVQGYGNSNPIGRMGNAGLDELVTEDGYYRIRIRVGGEPGTRGEPIVLHLVYNDRTPQEERIVLPVTGTLDQPEVIETVAFLRRGSPDQKRRLSVGYNNNEKYVINTPEFVELNRAVKETISRIRDAKKAGEPAEADRLQGELQEIYKRSLAWEGPARRINPEYAGEVPPQVFIDWLEFEGPLKGEWPPASHRALLFDGDERRDREYVREIFARFLPRAYRRPVSDGEVDRVVALVEAALGGGAGFHEALRLGLQRVLASPSFVFMLEPSGEGSRALTDFELASRLSYFLWSTMPDDDLFRLAAAGRLSDPAVRRGEVERMLADPKAREFVENFAGQWLQVREFGSVMPAENLYKEYDSELEESSKLEAYAFFEEVLRENLPLLEFLDSDWVMVNERLARHYGIEGVEGEAIRRVALEPEHHRGGVFGMAGLMTYLSDGTRTLPVRRAAWVVENLFNDPPPPPPPNAGEVQPNTAGEQLTVRERLERHRDEPTCASCHAELDPYGLALENYDAIGKWRTHQNGEGFRKGKSPELDVSGELPGGRSFASLDEFKAALLEEKDQFARAFAERMSTYALGRPVGYTDRELIENFVEALQADEYRIRTLVHAIVASPAFQSK